MKIKSFRLDIIDIEILYMFFLHYCHFWEKHLAKFCLERKINIPFIEYIINKVFVEFYSSIAKIWSILGIYLIIKYNHKKRKYLWKTLMLSVVCCLLTSNQYKLNIFPIWNSIVDSFCCFAYMYIQLGHKHKLKVFNSFFYKMSNKGKSTFQNLLFVCGFDWTASMW